MHKKIIEAIDKRFYPEYKDNWDNILFREKILKYISKDSVLLDIGAGAGLVKEMHFKDCAKEVYGVDPDPRVEENPHLTKGFIGYAHDMYFFPDNTFDVVFSNNVLEHIKEPLPFI